MSFNACEGPAWHPAIFFPNGTIQILRTLDPSYAYADAIANGINNPGDIVGDSLAPGGFHGFIFTNGKLLDLNNWSFR